MRNGVSLVLSGGMVYASLFCFHQPYNSKGSPTNQIHSLSYCGNPTSDQATTIDFYCAFFLRTGEIRLSLIYVQLERIRVRRLR